MVWEEAVIIVCSNSFFFFFSFSSFYFSVVVSCIRNEVGGSDPSYQKKKVSLYYSLDMYLKLVFL